jgi:hypothetical protein
MTAYGQNGSSQGCVVDLHAGAGHGGSPLDGYLLESTHKLNEITELVTGGKTVDLDSHHWMLAQVDFIVDAVGDDSLELNEEMRSNLLQLLLAVANLNEHIRHQAFLAR